MQLREPILSVASSLAARVAAVALVLSMLCAAPACARALAVETPVVRATFDDTGAYEVRCRSTRWSLEGRLSERPALITHRSGADELGPWREVQATTELEVAAIRGSVASLRYSEATRLFHVIVHPAGEGGARSAELAVRD